MASLVREHFADHASRWGLRPESLKVTYVPSPGGFGPMNFAVQDGSRSYHVKLRRTPDKLANWVKGATRLAESYRAPRLLGQIEVGGRYGIVLERLPGVSPPPPTPHHTLREIVSTLNALHKDRELAALIGGASCPARDAILQYHIPMCDDDLDSIEPALPLPFVDRAMGTWMRAETASLRSKALQSAAFDELVTSPIHGDLWFGNVLVQGDAWWIIDWDDLKIGDPVHDLSLILFPSLGSAHSAEAWLGARDAAFMERFDLYTRAALLTFVIDPLADWIEAESFPEVRDAARAHREQLHRWALERYVELYGE